MSIRKAMVTGMIGAAALLAQGDAGATDLKLSLGAAGEYNSNIFHRETKVRDDFVVLAIPRIGLADNEGKFTYDAGYSFPYEHSIKTNALRDFNHVSDLSMDYHMDDQTEFSFTNYFRYVDSLSNNFDQTPGVADNEERQEVLTNDATIGMVHLFSPRLRNETTIDIEVFSTTQDDRADNQTYSIASGLDYLITERQRAGGGFTFAYQNFDDAVRLFDNTNWPLGGGFFVPGVNVVQDVPHVEAFFVGPFLQWMYQIDEQSQLRVSGGPNYVHSSQDSMLVTAVNSVPPFVTAGDTYTIPSQSDDRWAFLGGFLVNRRWMPTMESALSYTRRQDTASGVSGSAILDAVALTHSWNLAETWTLAVRGDWTKRKGATNLDQGGVDELDTQRWGAGAVLVKQITRNFSSSLRYQYAQQHSQGNSAGSDTDFHDHIVTLGFNYSLDPIKVW